MRLVPYLKGALHNNYWKRKVLVLENGSFPIPKYKKKNENMNTMKRIESKNRTKNNMSSPSKFCCIDQNCKGRWDECHTWVSIHLVLLCLNTMCVHIGFMENILEPSKEKRLYTELQCGIISPELLSLLFLFITFVHHVTPFLDRMVFSVLRMLTHLFKSMWKLNFLLFTHKHDCCASCLSELKGVVF